MTMVFIYKILHGLLFRYLCDRIERGRDVHSYNTRNAENARTPNFLFSRSQNSLFYNGIHFYNSMPREIRRASTIAEFKTMCIAHVKSVF